MGNTSLNTENNKLLAFKNGENSQISYSPIFQNTTFLTGQQNAMFTSIKKKKVEGGSSSSRQFMVHIPTKTQWVCKCSERAILNQNLDGTPTSPPTTSINDYKEVLALKLYSLFKVATPETVLSKQLISESAKECYKKQIKTIVAQYPEFKSQLDIEVPRLHIMSRFIKQFTPLGIKFIEEYDKTNNQFYEVKNGVFLYGFGRALAVATFLYDYDCVGNSGSNMGYVINNGKAEILKIDAGEALPFLEDMTNAEEFHHDPKTRDMIFGTGENKKISFDNLTENDKKEFVEATKSILTAKDESIQQVFEQFILLDPSFKLILQKLLTRKANFLKAFSPQISALLKLRLKQIQTTIAIKIYENWKSSENIPNPRKQIIEENALLNAYNLENLNKSFQVPKSNQKFVGRKKELIQINEILQKQNVVCICGSGGLGKSQLAKQYLSKSKYSIKIWLHAEYQFSISQIKAYLHALYPESKQIKQPAQLMQYFYDKIGNDACVVFDNLENENQFESVVCKNSRAHIVITSRFRDWHYPKIQLQNFTPQDVRQYGVKFLCKNITISQSEALNSLLQGLPLAITQALAYIKQNREISVIEYCKRYKKDFQLLLEQKQNKHQIINNSLFTTIVLTLNSAKKRDPLTDEVMNFVALISNQIQQDLIEKYLQKKVGSSIDILVSYSIFDRQNRGIKVHRLTQQVSLMIQRKNNVLEQNLQNVFNWLIPQFEWNSRTEYINNYHKVKSLVPHGLSLCEIGRSVKNNEFNLIQTYFAIGEAQLYNYELAHPILQKCLQIAQQHCPKHSNICDLLFYLGLAYGRNGDFQKMKEATSAAFQLSQNLYGLQSDFTIKIMYLHACATNYLGDNHEAKRLFQQCLGLSKKVFGQINVTTAYILRWLGNFNLQLGYYEQQYSAHSEALEIFRKIYGQQHIETLQMRSIINYEFKKSFQESKVKILENFIQYRKRNSKTDSLDLGRQIAYLGHQHRMTGNYEKSLIFLKQGLTLIEKKCGPDSPHLEQALLNLGKLHLQIKKFQQSKMYLDRLLLIQLRYKSQQMKSLRDTYLAFCRYHEKVGQCKIAIQFNQKALQIIRSYPDPDYQYQLQALRILGRIYFKKCKHLKSVNAYKNILKLKLNNFAFKAQASYEIANNFRFLRNTDGMKLFLLHSLKFYFKSDSNFPQIIGNIFFSLSSIYLGQKNLIYSLNYGIKAFKIFVNKNEAQQSHQNLTMALEHINHIKFLLVQQNKNRVTNQNFHKCFKKFNHLRNKQQDWLSVFYKKRPSKWNMLTDSQKFIFLRQRRQPIKTQQFLTIQFRRFVAKLVNEKYQQIGDLNQKHAWDQIWYDEQMDLMKSYKNRKKQPILNTLDFLGM